MSIQWWEKTIHDLPWPSLTFLDLPRPSMTSSMTFYHLLRPLWPSMIECLLSRPSLISGPLKPKPKLILTEFQGLTLSAWERCDDDDTMTPFLFSRYPRKVRSMWNFLKLFTPVSWTAILLSMAAVFIFFQIAVTLGSKFGLKSERDYLVLFPFRCT